MTAAFMLVLACVFTPQVTPAEVAALDTARAEATREYASAPAAAAAYKRLERVREPLLTSGDPRAAIWYADAAEDALTLGLAQDDFGLDALVGLSRPESRERTGALLQQALVWTQRADELARTELAQGTATPALASRLDSVERARRIPLLRSVAAVWAVRVGALPPADTTTVLESAAARLQSLAPQLQGSARTLATLAAGAALAQLGRAQELQPLLGPIIANNQLDSGARVVAMVLMAEGSSTNVVEQRRSLATLRSRHASPLGDHARLVLGDADFRLALAAPENTMSASPPWQGWLDSLTAATARQRVAVRQSVLDRIAANCGGHSSAVVQLANALKLLRAAESRQQGAAELDAALSVSTARVPVELRVMAELELGRAELLLGRARDGTMRLLRFAQEHSADPSSRNAIDAAVIAARAIGDPALLATALATAVERFPDHPDHHAWRIEAAALALSPDASLLAVRDPAPRRFARAVEALERADRLRSTDMPMRADLAIAAAEAANEMRHADDALAALNRVADPTGVSGVAPGIPQDLRDRLLEERITALAISGRSIDGDRWVSIEREANQSATANACARVLRRQIPTDLASGLIEPPDAEVRNRISRLADATLRMAPPTPERDEIAVCALLLAQVPDAALPVARRVVAARGERADALLALAECIYAVGDQTALAESMQIYTRLARSATDGTPMWWIAELRRLQILERVNKNLDVISPRVARLQAAHPDLGGPAMHSQFLALAARHEQAASATAAHLHKD
jgi:tetratricopeptide (TPR) repeat protein